MTRPTSEKVVVGYLSPSMSHSAFRESLLDLIVYDVAYHRRIVDGGGRLSIRAGSNLSAPRNALVKQFLAYGKADWLWIVDSDMTFKPDTVERLLDHADPEKAPIVGGLCFGYDETGSVQPTLFGLLEDEAGGEPKVIRYHEWPPEAMFQVAATGAACLLVHRSVFERIRDAKVPGRGGRRGFNDAFPWFQETVHDDAPVGEDFTFCWRAGLLGIPIYVNTSIELGHMKDYELTTDVYLAQRARRKDASVAAVLTAEGAT